MYWSRGLVDILTALIYLVSAPLCTSVTLLGLRVASSSVLLSYSHVDSPKYTYPTFDDPKMAQLEDLISEGCQADYDWVETDLKSAGNSAFSRCV